MKKIDVISLLSKPLWQLSGEEYVAIHAYACSLSKEGDGGDKAVVRCKGVRALAEHCSCSESQVYKLLREGVLDPAILSRIGKSIVFDGEVAIKCAAEYQEHQRVIRSKQNNA